jgi:double-strand break repair helicase AddA, alphaproteobacterial type
MNDVVAPASPDPDALQRQASDPSTSVWVGASAGTGKTKVLTDRVLSLMLEGTPPHRILCLTFTKAAAAEMNKRIADQLSIWTTMPAAPLGQALDRLLGRQPTDDEQVLARQLFVRVLDTPGGMNIQTIHAFCQSLLGRFPLEAGIAPHFSVVDDRDAADMLADAARRVLDGAAQTGSRLAEAVAVITGHVTETRFQALVQMLAGNAGALQATITAWGSIDAVVAAIYARLGLDAGETPESAVANACADTAFDADGLRATVRALDGGGKADRERAAIIGGWLAADASERSASFAVYAKVYVTKADDGGLPQVKATRSLATKTVLQSMPAAEAILRDEGERLVAVLLRQRAAVTARASAALLTVGAALLDVYAQAKRARALLDYDDLIRATARLLEQDGGASWVLFKLDGGIDHLLIDEAQDTNPEQWRVVRALTAEFFAGSRRPERPRTVFAVGDVKQSIFSFQGAEPAEFLTNRAHFENEATEAGGRFRPVDLTISFRSTAAVLAAVDAVFARDAARSGVALDAQPIRHHVSAWRRDHGGLVELWPVVVAREEDEPEPWRPPVDRIDKDAPHTRLARLVAARIARMVHDREPLESQGRPIMAGDVMVLVRRRDAFVEQLVRALKDNHVAVAGVDRMVLNEQIAVMDLIALARFVLLPADDLTLACLLKSPLLDIDEDQLFLLAYGRTGSLWRALQAAAGEPAFAAAYTFLADLLALADQIPPFEFFAHVLAPLGGRRRFFARLGHEADEPITEFLDLAMRYERTHPPTLQGFIHWLERGAVQIKRDMEQATRDAVRVMTVHGAKGLQAPIVFLPDTTKVPQAHGAGRPPPILWSDAGTAAPLPLWPPSAASREPVTEREHARLKARMLEEYRRLLYVAMTRAEDRLIICGWRGRNAAADDCWYRLMEDGLRDAPGVERETDAFLEDAKRRGEFDAEPLVRRLRSPQRAEPASLAATETPVPDPLPDWATTPPPMLQPTLRPLSPSRAVETADPPVRPPLTSGGQGGYRRGQIIHRLLQSLPQMPAAGRADAVRHWLSRQARSLDAAAQAEVARQVLAIVDDPAFASIFGPDSLAEVPISGEVGGRLLSARVDRLVVAPDRITILDYKTDRPPPIDPRRVPLAYLRQMSLYRRAVADIFPNRAVECLLLWTDAPRLMRLPDDILQGLAP